MKVGFDLFIEMNDISVLSEYSCTLTTFFRFSFCQSYIPLNHSTITLWRIL